LHRLQLIAARPDFGANPLDDGGLAIGLRTCRRILIRRGFGERRLQNGVIAERPRRGRWRRKDFVINRGQSEGRVKQRRHQALWRGRLRSCSRLRGRPRLQARLIAQRVASVMTVPVAEIRYAEIEWPDTQTKGRARRRRRGDCGKRGNRNERTDFPHGQAPENSALTAGKGQRVRSETVPRD
jgi:hypothetical protein